MKSYIFSVLSAALFVAGVYAQSITVNTPTNVLSCTALQVTWTGGTQPYTLSVHDGTDPNGAALLTFTNLTGISYTWSSVTFAPNTNLDLTLRDSNGLISQSAPFTVQSGGSTSCLNSTGSSSPSTVVATNGASATAATTTNTGTTPATTGQTKATSSGSTPSGSSSAKTSSPSSAATSITASYGVAGVIGAVIAAVFV